jgi:hypothetical protein
MRLTSARKTAACFGRTCFPSFRNVIPPRGVRLRLANIARFVGHEHHGLQAATRKMTRLTEAINYMPSFVFQAGLAVEGLVKRDGRTDLLPRS